MGIALKISIEITAAVALLAMFFPRQLMYVYTDDKVLIDIGVSYLRIIGVSYFIMGFSQVYESTLRSVERAHVSTAITSVALLINVFLNAVFIFGLFGLTKMGVLGVAVATLILGHMGSDIVAANAVTTNVRDLCTILCFGMSAGGSVLLGKTIGERRVDDAKADAWRLCKITFMLYINSYYVVGQAMNTLTIAGIFRAGGDSHFGLI